VTFREPQLATTLAARKSIGAFYTRNDVTAVLCGWAIRGAADKVLEPSFGGCGFLDASLETLAALGCKQPEENVFGCDIADDAFIHLRERLPGTREGLRFVKADFLTLNPAALGGKEFDAVVGNPPYISNEKLSSAQRISIRDWQDAQPFKLTGRPSLWVHFVLHSASFLRDGGRMAWVLPGSFSTSYYARQVHDWLRSFFRRTVAISVSERLFLTEGTEETTVIVLADGYSKGGETGTLSWVQCDSAEQLAGVIGRWEVAADDATRDLGNKRLLDQRFYDAFQRFVLRDDAVILGDVLEVKIGLVTGDTPFFIRRPRDWVALGVSAINLRRILPKSKWVRGIRVSTKDILQYQLDELPCLMFHPTRTTSAAVHGYLAGYSKDDLSRNATFKKRERWYLPDDDKIPDLFGVFMTHHGPRVMANSAQINATNSYYRLYYKPGARATDGLLCAISMQSTVTQFAAEVNGRPRGSGALKLEPSEFRALPVFRRKDASYWDARKAFDRIDQLLRKGDEEAATAEADRFLFEGLGPAEVASLSTLREGIVFARRRRLLRRGRNESHLVADLDG